MQTRYVVFGTGAQLKTQNDLLAQSDGRNASRKTFKNSSKPSLVDDSEEVAPGLFISIYKAKVNQNLSRYEEFSLTNSRVTGTSLHNITSQPLSPVR